ncbi:carboxypeptidase-like regulatory domain-containing protein [Herpetosiphon sp. NSE202]|uniref:carboxypeptidase-like regulatory domain-containing protein n=1 Tax=Herpetosiphon sp. NSE202 TaxID=3351349 RepID=UPI00363BD3C8
MLRSTIFMRWMLAIMLLISISGCTSTLEVTMEYSPELSAQLKGNRFIYQGRVVDGWSNDPIPNVQVSVSHGIGSHDKIFIDAHGNFTTTMRLSYNEIKITADGYKPYEGIWNLCR